MLENKKHNGIHYSRYIASWRNMGGRFFDEEFKEWLRSEGFSDEEIREVKELAECGKLELETTAKQFIDKEKEMIKKFEDKGYAEGIIKKRAKFVRIKNKMMAAVRR